MAVDQELSALATVASLLPTDIIYLVRDPGGVAEADNKVAVSVLDTRYLEAADVGTAAYVNVNTLATAAQGALADTALQAAAIGVTVQAYDAGLSAITAFGRSLIAAVDSAAGRVIMVSAGTGVANTFTAAQKINVNSTAALFVEQDGVKDNVLVVDTTNGRIGIGTASPAGSLHISEGLSSILLQNVTTDATNKQAKVLVAHYTNAEEAVQLFLATASSTHNTIQIGGSASSFNAATIIQFYAGANNTTLTGTPIMRMSAAGMRIDPAGATTAPGAVLHINQSSTTAAVPAVRLEQLDLSEDFIEFNGTVATGNPIEAIGAKTLTTTHFLRVSVNGSFVYIPCGTIA